MLKLNKQDLIICNQIAIMEALVVLMAQSDFCSMDKTWQFDHLKRMIKESQK